MEKTKRGQMQPSVSQEIDQREYLDQQRLADALFSLFKTLGNTLDVTHVAHVGLHTLMGQLLIKRAAFLERDQHNNYRVTAVAGARAMRLSHPMLPGDVPEVVALFGNPSLLGLTEELATRHEAFEWLHANHFENLFALASDGEPLAIIALGPKITRVPFTGEDRRILDVFSVVISLCLKNSLAYRMIERSRNELERMGEMKREFMTHVSHELRTPLTILKNLDGFMDLEAEVGEMYQAAIARLEHLVNSILLCNEINVSGVHIDLMLVDMQDWIKEQLLPMLARHGSFGFDSDVPVCTLEFDYTKIGIAIESVVANAVKFRGDGGGGAAQVYLYLTTRERLVLSLEAQDEKGSNLAANALRPHEDVDPCDPSALLVIEVADRGIGIPADDIKDIFQPFTQATNSPTRGVKGAGLGLAMAKRIVDAHGGEILCRSVVGHGTNFYIAIPAISGFLWSDLGDTPSREPA